MKVLLNVLPVLFALSSGAVHAQLYKWVGPDGSVTYSDTPPPTAAKVETKPLGGPRPASGVGLPYELAQAVRQHPVTLYAAANCVPCDDGRKLLNERGIPFTEKTVSTNEDIAALRTAGGDGSLPLLTVGRLPQHGFEPGAWNNALTAAGYPATSQLPRSYRNPPAEPAAPRVQAAAQANPGTPGPAGEAPADTARPTELPPATGNAPPGFRF